MRQKSLIRRLFYCAGAAAGIFCALWAAQKYGAQKKTALHKRAKTQIFGKTETPFVYAARITGEPLFLSSALIGEENGLLLFSGPIHPGSLNYAADLSSEIPQVAVFTRRGNQRLGAVREGADGKLSYRIARAALTPLPVY